MDEKRYRYTWVSCVLNLFFLSFYFFLVVRRSKTFLGEDPSYARGSWGIRRRSQIGRAHV